MPQMCPCTWGTAWFYKCLLPTICGSVWPINNTRPDKMTAGRSIFSGRSPPHPLVAAVSMSSFKPVIISYFEVILINTAEIALLALSDKVAVIL